MYRLDISLNIMSLGGLTLGVGMLVDNAIVVLEAIHRKRDEGIGLAKAAIDGASEVAGAVNFLMSAEAAYITRQVIAVNGGLC